jgi:conjugal transfer pilus assembly protein TraU
MRHFKLWLATLIVCLGTALPAAAQSIPSVPTLGCSSANPAGLFTDFCYDSMFPIRLMGSIDIPATTDVSPPGHAASYTTPPFGCFCWKCVLGVCVPIPGMLRGAWIPVQVIEATRAPGCVVMLEGLNFGSAVASLSRFGGEATKNTAGEASGGFRHFTMYDFPLGPIFAGMLGMAGCSGLGPSFETVMSSMLLSFWERTDLANLLFPEAFGFATPLNALTAPVSCASATMGLGTSMVDDHMFWSMGCWGRTYPLTGSYGTQSAVTGSSLIAARAMYTMGAVARFTGGQFSKYGITTVGNAVANGGCTPMPSLYLRKSEFKMAQIFPVPESGLGVASMTTPSGAAAEASPIGMLLSRCAHRVGESEMKWGPHRKAMVTGEDQAYLIWRWVDCCLL